MPSSLSGGYFPLYPQHDSLPDPEIRTFITNFYKTSDNPTADELWVSYFTKDAQILIGDNGAKGEKEIREARALMWATMAERKHVVTKVFPGRFSPADASDGESSDCECMMFGEVQYKTSDGSSLTTPWAAHAVLHKETDAGDKEEWKFARYRVWLQK
ncbi:hypothetical protein B0I35DRAFT_21190 [Stachybotrys elegans]|uniref:SnoaL-like domain-containing protein n=1 Tax=Stachybotrys elegans TaxID=80388 RepID=A0A8K0WY64_9HYPO|nr:hypothetical protein B0I35DRAFT_21190 [Stachybotrys elegans]